MVWAPQAGKLPLQQNVLEMPDAAGSAMTMEEIHKRPMS
jgi:hypothetical protein